MNVIFCLGSVKIPPEFINKTAFLFEIKDGSFLHLGIHPGSIALVDNSKEFSTKFPVAFTLEDETYVGLPKKIAEDLYYLETVAVEENQLLFSLHEIKLIGHVRGVYRQNRSKTGFVFEKLYHR